MALGESLDVLSGLLTLPNLEVLDVPKGLYETAVEEARTNRIGANDMVAFILMKKKGVTEVYSFDTDFDKLKGIRRITE